MKPVQILLIIFCLGIFLIPKDNFYAQALQESCCKAESKTKSCCEKNHKDHNSEESKNDHQSCNDDCCSICITCHSCVGNFFAKNNFLEIPVFKSISEPQFEYVPPFISNRLEEIWQPPKLG